MDGSGNGRRGCVVTGAWIIASNVYDQMHCSKLDDLLVLSPSPQSLATNAIYYAWPKAKLYQNKIVFKHP